MRRRSVGIGREPANPQVMDVQAPTRVAASGVQAARQSLRRAGCKPLANRVKVLDVP